MIFTSTEVIGLVVIAAAVLLIGWAVTRLDQRVGSHMDESFDTESEQEEGEQAASQAAKKQSKPKRRRR